jgi:hypothetical protein
MNFPSGGDCFSGFAEKNAILPGGRLKENSPLPLLEVGMLCCVQCLTLNGAGLVTKLVTLPTTCPLIHCYSKQQIQPLRVLRPRRARSSTGRATDS